MSRLQWKQRGRSCRIAFSCSEDFIVWSDLIEFSSELCNSDELVQLELSFPVATPRKSLQFDEPQ